MLCAFLVATVGKFERGVTTDPETEPEMRQLRFITVFILGLAAIAGCATNTASDKTPSGTGADTAAARKGEKQPAPDTRPTGPLSIDIANVLAQPLAARVDLVSLEDYPVTVIEVRQGKLETQAPVGQHRAYIHVYDGGVPYLVGIQDLTVSETGGPAKIATRLLEGSAGSLSVRAFDFDGDLAIDRVEEEAGTNPKDAGSLPGRPMVAWTDKVLSEKAGWYRGEMHAYSSYSHGSESVADLVRRAEQSGLDFLAITDRNMLDAVNDPGFRSEKVVLIPAMEWGDDKMGVALAYGMRAVPEPASSVEAAQAECLRIQAQGGIFAVAHPCFPTAPWQWNVSYVNAIEVWCRAWRAVPPITLDNLRENLKIRDDKNDLIYSIAAAAAITSHSANAQATQFWDYETVRGLKASAIAGSGSASPKVPLGRPLTYVYAKNKSAGGILDGLRQGRTFVTSGPDGPRLTFTADVLNDGKVDVGIGGTMPLGLDTMFEVNVSGANGKKLHILRNGHPIVSKVIDGDNFVFRCPQRPITSSVYRVRITEPPANDRDGFGPTETLAMSSPIYAEDIVQDFFWQDPNIFLNENYWFYPSGEQYDPKRSKLPSVRGMPTSAGPPQDVWQVPMDQEPVNPLRIGR